MSSKTEKKRAASEKKRAEVIKAAGAKLGRGRTVELYGGQASGELVTASDPDTGITVEHAIRRDLTVADRLLKNGSLGAENGEGRLYHQAAERFRQDFERAQLTGFVGAADLMRGGGGGPQEIEDSVVGARERVRYALGSLGFAPGTSRGSQVGKAAWWVLGCQETLEQFSNRMRTGGSLMNVSKASGLVIAAIERLALHYGIVAVSNIDQLERSRAWGQGVMSAARRLRQDAERVEKSAAFAKRRALTDESLGEDQVKALLEEAAHAPIIAKWALDRAASMELAARRVGGGQ